MCTYTVSGRYLEQIVYYNTICIPLETLGKPSLSSKRKHQPKSASSIVRPGNSNSSLVPDRKQGSLSLSLSFALSLSPSLSLESNVQ